MPAREIYLIVREEVEGPFTLEEIHRQVASGRIAPDLLCAVRGSTEWKPLADLLGEHEETLRT
jgi:hypothetical protein